MYNLDKNLNLKGRNNSPGGNVLYLSEYSNVQSIDYDGNGYISGITMVGSNKFYKYDLPKSNLTFSNNVDISVPNACFVMKPILSFNTPGLQASKLKLYDFLVRKSVIAIVKTNMGQYFVLGAGNGMDLESGSNFTSGQAGVDLIGANLKLSGSEVTRITQIDPIKVDNIMNSISYVNIGLILSFVSRTSYTISVIWDFNNENSGNVTLQKSIDGNNWTSIYYGNDLTYTDTGLIPETYYYYRIKYDTGLDILYSNQLYIMTMITLELRMELVITGNTQSVTIPHIAGYIHNYIINWGDSTGTTRITTYNDTGCTHIYSTYGTYIVKISGTCETLYTNNNGTFRLTLNKITDWGNVGIKVLNLHGCENLISIFSDSYFGLSNIINFDYSFANCFDLIEIPENLFQYNISVTTMNFTFSNCQSLTSIPENLFKYNINITQFWQTFSNCLFETIPENLFKFNINIINFYNVFYSCIYLLSIPENLFKYNILVKSFGACFHGCQSITSIPENLFNYNINVKSFGSCFHGCQSITSIPENLFNYNINVNNFEYTFKDNIGIISSAPTLWITYPTATSTQCFNGCTNLSNYASIPAAWK